MKDVRGDGMDEDGFSRSELWGRVPRVRSQSGLRWL
jgi:hypothetical protein